VGSRQLGMALSLGQLLRGHPLAQRQGQPRRRALDAAGEPFVLDAEGLLAVCIQHEMDHLEGKVFVEKLSRLKQSRILARLKKQDRRAVEPEARRLVL